MVNLHTQSAREYNPELVRQRNTTYAAHVAQCPAQRSRAHLDPSAVLLDKVLVAVAHGCAEAFNGVDTSSLDDEQTTALIAAITSASKASTATTLAAAGVGRPCGSLSPPPPAPAAAIGDRYARLATDSTGQPGLCASAIRLKRRDDVRRNGHGAMRFVTGARLTAGAHGKGINDEGKVAHGLIAAYMAVEANRRMPQATHVERLEAFRRQMVARHGAAEAVIGKDGMLNGKGEERLYSRSFMYSLVRHPELGAELRWNGADEEEARTTGPIGDEWTFGEIQDLLSDPRVPPELVRLLRHSDALLVESELAEAELVLGYCSTPAIQVKVVNSSVEAVPLEPRWSTRAMAGGAPMATFATHEFHRTAVGYRYLTYKMPSFNFETCACAMWTAHLFTLLPLSNQSGGDNRILTSDRFGVVDANGTKGGVNKTRYYAPPLYPATLLYVTACAILTGVACAAAGLRLGVAQGKPGLDAHAVARGEAAPRPRHHLGI